MTAADDALAAILDAGAVRATALGSTYRELWDALRDACHDGKRFRPALVVTAHDAFGGSVPECAARVGAALELLHTAFVIHDDVIDGDHTRRGRPNVSGVFAATARSSHVQGDGVRTYADAAGILAGDLALVAAVRAVAGCRAAPEITERLLDLVDGAVQTTAAGELSDVRLGLTPGAGSLGEALTVSERKTAVYSFVLPLQAGALLAGADDDVIGLLGRIGRALGIGFQLVDDLLGVFGDEEVTGKSALTDLREGKCTPLVAHARSTHAWPDLAPLLGDPGLGAAGARRARELLTTCGSRAFVEHLAVDYVSAATDLARRHDLPAAFRDELDHLSRRILGGGRADGAARVQAAAPVPAGTRA